MFNTDLKFIKGVGEKRAEALHSLGIHSVGSLLRYYPRAYENWGEISDIASAVSGTDVCIRARISSTVNRSPIRKNMTVYKFFAEDGTGTLLVTLFNNDYLAKSLVKGEEYLFYGRTTGVTVMKEMNSPKIKPLSFMKIRPVYPSAGGLSSADFERMIGNALQKTALNETLPQSIIDAYSLCGLDTALRNIHFPKTYSDVYEARRRLAFEEMFVLQSLMIYSKMHTGGQSGIAIADRSHEFIKGLPYVLTAAQLRTVAECTADMNSGHPMHRLVQGDVGSGKTVVAAAVIYSCIKNGYQAALMVPTEVLAEQHFNSMQALFKDCGVNICLLTGSVTKSNKQRIKDAVGNGKYDLVIGTHAVIQEDVAFKNLALVVTDEQHRFGVAQRASLYKKGVSPHMLVMSATPIPRTLAMIVYGELDISIIDEMPKGRQPIDTFAVTSDYHTRIYNYVKKHLDEGRQGYIVCPLVEEGETDNGLIPATEYYKQLQDGPFRNYSVGLLHGKMKPREKDKVMKAFAKGEIQLLVATTVIEVGIDVPNAVIMVIENADRFGLSQLHQLRGRIGRGAHKSTCILVSDAAGKQSALRLGIMCRTSDGFKIADEDLKMRGPGDIIGKRQHGLPELKIADLTNDIELFRQAGKAAAGLIKSDPKLTDYPELREMIKQAKQIASQ